MTIKDKLKSYNFWITLVSAIILLLQVFGEKFNFKIDSNFIIDVTTGLCSIFVVLGIISVPKAKTTKTDIRFIEPNYQELSAQISKELANKLENICSQDQTSCCETSNEEQPNFEKENDNENELDNSCKESESLNFENQVLTNQTENEFSDETISQDNQ